MNNAKQQTSHYDLISHHIEHLVYLCSLGYNWVSSKPMVMVNDRSLVNTVEQLQQINFVGQ